MVCENVALIPRIRQIHPSMVYLYLSLLTLFLLSGSVVTFEDVLMLYMMCIMIPSLLFINYAEFVWIRPFQLFYGCLLCDDAVLLNNSCLFALGRVCEADS